VGLSVPHRVRGVKVLKAVSSPLRLQILNLLFDKGPLSYTELMSSLKMNPSRDAGRFAYHLKFLLKADLLEADVEARKYLLTELGKMVIDVADRVERKALKPKGMLVRTSRLALEEFDANKIANSLIREAKMPAELAQKVAKETEKRLLKSRTKYLTAPLVREVVNAILIEKGLEEHRHKLTRLGLPVHEVASLVEAKSKASQGSSSVHQAAGETVLEEYALLKVFPRDISDAHLSGLIHVHSLGSWVLEPSEVMHDLRFFFQNGLNLEKPNAAQPAYPPPENFDSALALVFNVLLHSAKEIDKMQTVDYFNVFLAPFVKGVEPSRVKEALRIFVLNVSQHVPASLGLELTIPGFVGGKPALGPFGKPAGKYSGFAEESQLLASLVLDVFSEENVHKPLLNPQIILKIRPETFTDEIAKALFLKAHNVASQKGSLYFADLLAKNEECSIFSGLGCKLATDLDGDWEIDTVRTGCLGQVTVNLPRIAYESEKDKTKFSELLRERLEMAARALEIKYRLLKQHGEGLLPFLMQSVGSDQYFRLENCTGIINLAGLGEAAEWFTGKSINDEKTLQFIEETAQAVQAFMHKAGRRHGKRMRPANVPDTVASERLAQSDVERYGIAKVRFSGTKDKPFYSTAATLTLRDGKVQSESLAVGRKLSGFHAGGSLAVFELGESEYTADELMGVTQQILEDSSAKLFTYNRRLTYCIDCKKSWFGLLHKCPSCGAIGTLTVFDRFAGV
jgi:anaerobic ribonucleoside-triphosphate reductase